MRTGILITAPKSDQGFATGAEARREGCSLLMLDAYVENFKAHRFYYRHGFHARGFHYLKHI